LAKPSAGKDIAVRYGKSQDIRDGADSILEFMFLETASSHYANERWNQDEVLFYLGVSNFDARCSQLAAAPRNC
jgi:hypothetical protein